MKRQPLVTSLLLIVCLVFSQVGGVFASEPAKCSMASMSESNMMHPVDSSLVNKAETTIKTHSSDSTTMSMGDCCEDAASTPCCLDDCKCADALISFAFISADFSKSIPRLAQQALDDSSFALLHPQIQRLQRPPINSFS